MSLSEVGVRTMLAEISAGATADRVERLRGGLATTVFGVRTTRGEVVVKIFRPGDDRAPLEWQRLTFAQRVDIPVPEPVALDAEGRWFGSAALVTTRLPGYGSVRPADLDGWLRQLAAALAAIHATDITGADGPLLPAGHWGNRELSKVEWPSGSALVDRVVDAIRRHRLDPDVATVLMHGDYHPGNVLWRDGALTGVVDWNGTRLGSAGFDLAYCRADVAVLFGLSAARRLSEHYVTRAGSAPTDLPVFDLMSGLAARRWGAALWLRGYRDQGCSDTPRQIAARVTPFLRQALAELGA